MASEENVPFDPTSFEHIPVLLNECLEGLAIDPAGTYLDGTAGGAGHSRQIALRLDAAKGGRLISLDQDPDAVQTARARLAGLPATVVQINFRYAGQALEQLGIEKINGALLDLGADQEKLEQVLKTIPAQGFDIQISKVLKSGISAVDFDVLLDHEHENHDHDMAYLFGENAPEAEEHHHHHHDHHDHDGHPHDHDDHHHDHHHDHDHDHDDHHHGHDGHHHEHRSLQDVLAVIDGTQMTQGAKELAGRIFRIVAEAESEVHARPLNEVHFHEVGAIDSIVDIISIAVCFDDLREKEQISDVVVPVLYEGTGTVRCQHGVLPIPVPAVAAIVRKHGIRMHLIPDLGEFVTPTGAACVAALRTSDQLPAEFVIRKTGLGAGKREYRRAGVVRAMLLED